MRRVGLRAKLLLGALVLLLPVLGLSLRRLEAERADRLERALAEQVRIAETAASLVDVSLEQSLDLGWTLASDPIVRSFDTELLDPHLQQLASRHSQYCNVEVFNARGESVGASIPYATGEPRAAAAESPYFQHVMATGQAVVSDAYVSPRFAGQATVVGVVPIMENGRALGAVQVAYDLTRLPANLAGVPLGPGETLFALDRQGRLVFHSLLPDLSWEERDLSYLLPAMQAATAGEPMQSVDFRSPYFGDKRILTAILVS